MFRMTTLWGQVLMFICRFVVYVSWHNTIFTGGVSIQKGDVMSRCFMGEFKSGWTLLAWSQKRLRFSSDSVHFMSTSSMKRNQESGLWGADCMISFQVSPWRCWRMKVPSLFP
jgi:hypothetical protein